MYFEGSKVRLIILMMIRSFSFVFLTHLLAAEGWVPSIHSLQRSHLHLLEGIVRSSNSLAIEHQNGSTDLHSQVLHYYKGDDRAGLQNLILNKLARTQHRGRALNASSSRILPKDKTGGHKERLLLVL